MSKENQLSLLKGYNLNKGMKKIVKQVKYATVKETKQLHDRVVFEPVSRNDLTEQENKRSMGRLILLVQKQIGKIKASTVVNGITQRAYIDRDNTAIPTATSNTIIINGVIESKQGRDAMINDVTNDFSNACTSRQRGRENYNEDLGSIGRYPM